MPGTGDPMGTRQDPRQAAPRGRWARCYIPGVTVAVPLLLALIGLALIVGRRSPPWIIAGVFLIIGFYMGQTTAGKEIVSGFNALARLIG